MVPVVMPDGTAGNIPADQVDKFIQDHPGAKRTDQQNTKQSGPPEKLPNAVNNFNTFAPAIK
jgi:hypothetical protein